MQVPVVSNYPELKKGPLLIPTGILIILKLRDILLSDAVVPWLSCPVPSVRESLLLVA